MKPQFVLFLTLSLLCLGTGAALAQTPDELPPSLETVCDMETGAAFGHCNAYCEAMDCELANDSDPNTNPSASANACSKVRTKFQQATGRDVPCEVTCPCNTRLFPCSLVLSPVKSISISASTSPSSASSMAPFPVLFLIPRFSRASFPRVSGFVVNSGRLSSCQSRQRRANTASNWWNRRRSPRPAAISGRPRSGRATPVPPVGGSIGPALA